MMQSHNIGDLRRPPTHPGLGLVLREYRHRWSLAYDSVEFNCLLHFHSKRSSSADDHHDNVAIEIIRSAVTGRQTMFPLKHRTQD